ncbi:MAG: GNAT family N-acetyltransferase [Clostridia bacterium]|nr:GNAT family N-acetyltransferase [Clostridia bacterium]
MNNFTENNVEILSNPSDAIVKAIANKHGVIADKVFRGLKHTIERAQSYTGYFCVVLYNKKNDVIGFAHFIQNSKQTEKWFYTDLWVEEKYQRLGNAKRLVTAGCEYLSNIGAKYLMCTVDGQNMPSIKTQTSLGFKEIEAKPFEFFDNTDLLMFVKEIF